MFTRELLPDQTGHPPLQEAQIFNYDMLDCETRIVVQQRTGEIKEKIHNVAQLAWEIGQKLADVRGRLRPRQFTFWLQTEFQWSRSTAYNYIKVFESFPICPNFGQIDIATSALILLAAPSTPNEAREEALERASKGESISHTEAKAIRTRYKDVTKHKSGKQVTVNVPAFTLEREVFTADNTDPLESKKDELSEIEPTRYAIPLQTAKEEVEHATARAIRDRQEPYRKEEEAPQQTKPSIESLEGLDKEEQSNEDSLFERIEGKNSEDSLQPEGMLDIETVDNQREEEGLSGNVSDAFIKMVEVNGSSSTNEHLNFSFDAVPVLRDTDHSLSAPATVEEQSSIDPPRPKNDGKISEFRKVLARRQFSREALEELAEDLVYLLLTRQCERRQGERDN